MLDEVYMEMQKLNMDGVQGTATRE